jgi:hypothetical protein
VFAGQQNEKKKITMDNWQDGLEKVNSPLPSLYILLILVFLPPSPLRHPSRSPSSSILLPFLFIRHRHTHAEISLQDPHPTDDIKKTVLT